LPPQPPSDSHTDSCPATLCGTRPAISHPFGDRVLDFCVRRVSNDNRAVVR
jgi:hypothetical protein